MFNLPVQALTNDELKERYTSVVKRLKWVYAHPNSILPELVNEKHLLADELRKRGFKVPYPIFSGDWFADIVLSLIKKISK